MSKVEEALECFNNGFNCSQAIISTYCEQFGVDRETALKISCGFGGGMSRLGETCGAVSSAIMLIGLKYGNAEQDDKQAKNKTFKMVREFTDSFKQRNQFIRCDELLKAKLPAENGDGTLKKKKACSKLVQDTAEIIEELLELV